MKDNYSGMVALLEYMDRKTAQKPAKVKSLFRDRIGKDVDIIALIKRKKEEAELLEKFLKDSGKKEEKKAEKNDMSKLLKGLEWFIIGILSYPIVGPAYQAMIHAVPK